MPKSYKRDRKRTTKGHININAARKKKQALRAKKNGTSNLKAIRDNWDSKQSAAQNLSSMGLSYKVNKAVPLPLSAQSAEFEVAKLADLLTKKSVPKKEPSKKHVIEMIEKTANEEEQKAGLKKKNRKVKLLPKDIQFCTQMIQRHGLDFDAMARDHLNLYQETASQIKRKIEIFKRSEAYKTVVGSEAQPMES